jgi:hypothetical protein
MDRIAEIKKTLEENYGEFSRPITDWRYHAIKDLLTHIEELEKLNAQLEPMLMAYRIFGGE